MWRLVALFQAKRQKLDELTDKFMISRVGVILLFQTALIVFWKFVQIPAAIEIDHMLPNTNISFKETVCSYLGSPVAVGPLFVNALFLLGVVYYAFIGRKIPAEYNDSQYIGVFQESKLDYSIQDSILILHNHSSQRILE
jgi:hypothetical protein